MRFTKMHGAGNDYIYVNCFQESVPEELSELAIQISHRRFGVGADGLILIMPSTKADARMRMFNADGSESEMCGNGIRCVAKYVYDHGICHRDQLQIETGAGILTVKIHSAGNLAEQVTVDMGQPILRPDKIPTTLGAGLEQVVHQKLEVDGHSLHATCVSMGNPHCVIFVPDASDELVLKIGPKIEMDARFPKRTNVEFVEVLARNEVRQRTWERGSGETWACGTGASAVCVAGVLTGNTDREIHNHLLGGDLVLRWDEATNHVHMTGPAREVFTGEWKI
jgi:diaminopimelate epimerase